MALRYCIVCGDPFQSDDPRAALCPACGGPSPAAEDHTVAVGEPASPAPSPQPVLSGRGEIQAGSAWQVGDVILDTYEVRHIFTSGGMGLVYRVHHRGWNMDLALKSPRAEIFTSAGGKESFVREAETWVDLGLHPHIVSCYYVRTIDEIPRVFAEYVEGGSLKDWIEDRRLYEGGQAQALERMLDIAIQFNWGLAYAHEQGLVHQDVKPANVLMTPEGVVKVSDFGLAKARAAAGEGAGTGQDRRAGLPPASANPPGESIQVSFGGMTPAYCSPEQARKGAVSRKTDIWSWGVSLLEMFVGEVTWYSGQAAGKALEGYLEMGAEAEAIPPMPGGLADLLRQCFQETPAERPADMLEVAGRLQEIYRREVGQAYPRQLPKAAELLADGLNNKALSMMDLGQEEKALATWEQALLLDPMHEESTYNQGLVQWRNTKITDEVLLERMSEVSASHLGEWKVACMAGYVHLERGDGTESKKILETIQESDVGREEVVTILRLARSPNATHRRLLRTVADHTSDVRSACLSSNSHYALSAGWGHTFKLWDILNGDCLRTFEGHTRGIKSVCLSNEGRYAFSGSGDMTIKMWDVINGHCLRTFAGHKNEVNSVSLSADGRYVLSCSGGIRKVPDNTIRLWDVESGRCLRIFHGHTSFVKSVCMRGDGHFGLSGSWDHTLKLWDISNGCCVRTLQGHNAEVNAVFLSSDGCYALSGSQDKTLKLWELESGKCLRTFQGHTSYVQSVCLSPDMRFALSGGWDKTLKLWEVASGRCLYTFMGHTGYVESVSFSVDGCLVLSGSRDKTLKVWEVDITWRPTAAPFNVSRPKSSWEIVSDLEVYTHALSKAGMHFQLGQAVEAARHLRKARSLPGYSHALDALDLWRGLYGYLPRQSFLGAWEETTFEGHDDYVKSVCLSANGQYALSGSDDKTLKLWELKSGNCLRTLKGNKEIVEFVCLSEDGQYALSSTSEDEINFKLWKLASGRCLHIFEGHTDYVNSISLSKDGCYVLTGSSDKTLKLWELASGSCVRTFEGHTGSVTSVCLSVDGCYALSASHDKTLKLWELASGRCLRTFEGHTKFVAAVYASLDGCYVISCSWDKTLKLWQVADGHCLRTFEGHTDSINSVCLSADGRYAISGSRDKTLRLWEVENGRCLRTFEGHKKSITSVCLSPDGRYAVSGSQDNTLKRWALDWELEDREPADWDEGARIYLENFLTLHTPYAGTLPHNRQPTEEEITLALTRRGAPAWTEEDFKGLLYTLGCAGFGWLKPEGVRRELERMAAERGKNV